MSGQEEGKSNTQILFVDDEPGVRSAFKREMRGNGLDVDVAADADEAIALAQRHHYPLVVTDLKMPGRSGVGLIRELRSISPDTQYIVVTGVPELMPGADESQVPVRQVIHKPWNRDTLADAIAGALASFRGHQVYAAQADSQRPDSADDEG